MSPTRVLALGRGFLAGSIFLFYTPRVVSDMIYDVFTQCGLKKPRTVCIGATMAWPH